MNCSPLSRMGIFLLLTLLAGAFVHALGVSPANTRITFSPLLHYSGAFTLYNQGTTPLPVTILASGELAPYASLPPSFSIPASSSQRMEYTLDLPQTMQPGFHTLGIIIAQDHPPSSGSLSIGATVAVLTTLTVFVPYPEKYVAYDLSVLEHSSSVEFLASVENLGQADISRVSATMEISDAIHRLDTLTTDVVSLHPEERRDLIAEWVPSVGPGEYTVKLTLHYDGDQSTLKRDFSIRSEAALELESVALPEIVVGDVAEVGILLKNRGNTRLDGIVVEMRVLDERDVEVTALRSPTLALEPFSDESTALYWDTSTLQEGKYTTTLLLQYAGRTQEYRASTDVKGTSVVTTPFLLSPLTGRAAALSGERWSSFQRHYLFALAGIILVLIFLFTIVIIRRKNHTL